VTSLSCGVSRDQGDASWLPPQNRVAENIRIVRTVHIDSYRLILIPIGDYSDSDTSSESEYESDQESTPGSDYDTNELYENLEPELSETIHDEYKNAPWNPDAQLKAQFNTARLAQLHANIKARAQLPDPTYQKLHRS
jgi:hypothetical protein